MRSSVILLLLLGGLTLHLPPCPGQGTAAAAAEGIVPVRTGGSTMPLAVVPQDEETRPRSPLRDSYIGLGFGTGAISNGDLYGLTEFSACYTKPVGEDQVGAAYLLVQHAPIQQTSRLKASLDGGVIMLGLSGDFRFYRTPLYTFIGHYLSAGIGVHLLAWKYLHELQLPQYDDNDNFTGYKRVTNDAILGFDLHGGMGFDVGQVWDLHLEGELTPGLMLWSGKSTNGFNNDLFKPFFYLKARVMARVAI